MTRHVQLCHEQQTENTQQHTSIFTSTPIIITQTTTTNAPQHAQPRAHAPSTSSSSPSSSSSSSVLPRSLPSSYHTQAHIWKTIPSFAQPAWIATSAQKLQAAITAHQNGDIHIRDQVFTQLVAQPHTLLGRIVGQRGAARQLNKTLQQSLNETHTQTQTHQHTTNNTHNETEHIHQGHEQEQEHKQEQEQEQKQEHKQEQEQEQTQRDTRDPMTRKIKKAIRHVVEGHLSRAVSTLTASSVAPINDKTIRKLQALHPAASAPLPPLDNLTKHTLVSGDNLCAHADRFYDNGSAPGPSGWTGAMLTPLISSPACRPGLALLFSLIMNGDIADGPLKDMLRCARLIPISKPDDGIRPIAIGELFVRVSANLLINKLQLQKLFPEIQYGVGISGGTEKAIHSAQAWLERHVQDKTTIMIKTDIRNAYNTCSRSITYDALTKHAGCESLIRMFHWSHDSASPLLVYSHTDGVTNLAACLSSAEGQQQGHPLSGIAFDVSVHPVYVSVRARFPHVQVIAIHDDLQLVGPAADAFAAYDFLHQLLNERGDLQLQPAKCKVLIPTKDTTTQQQITTQAQQRHMNVQIGSMDILGGCVGSDDDIMRDTFNRQMSKVEPLIDTLTHPAMPPQVAFHILRHCIITRLGYHSRVTRPSISVPALTQFDHMIHQVFTRIHGLSFPLPPSSLSLLPHLGINQVRTQASPAYLASLCAAMPFLPELIPAPPNSNLTHIKDELTRVHAQVMSWTANNIDVSSRIPATVEQTIRQYSSDRDPCQLQQFIHTQLVQADKEGELAVTDNTRQAQVRRAAIRSMHGPRANIAFQTIPTQTEYMMTPADWKLAVRARLLLPPHDHMPSRCPSCHHALDTDYDRVHHHHSCIMLRRTESFQRHEMVLNAVVRLAKDKAGYITTKETRQWNAPSRIPDAMLTPTPYNTRIHIDVSVTHPCAARYYVHASSHSLSAAKTRSRLKHTKYDQWTAQQGSHNTFIPMVAETYGAITHEFNIAIQDIITHASEHHHMTPPAASALLAHAYATIGFALLRGNAAMARKLVAIVPPRDTEPQQHRYRT